MSVTASHAVEAFVLTSYMFAAIVLPAALPLGFARLEIFLVFLQKEIIKAHEEQS